MTTWQRKALAWFLMEVVDGLNHRLVLSARWPNYLPEPVAETLIWPFYQLCCRIVEFHIAVNPDSWPLARPVTVTDFLWLYEEYYDDRVELRVDTALRMARKLQPEETDAREG